MNQKSREDSFISERRILTNIDNSFYNIIHDGVNKISVIQNISKI